MRCAIYGRFSTEKQDFQSIADQYRVCEQYTQRQGWEIVARYADEGISGAAIGNRPEFNAMMADAMQHKFDVLLVMELSRLSRSAGDLNKTIDRLTFRGVRVIGVSNGYDTARKGHKLQAGVEGVMGEAFRDMVRDKTYTALSGRAERGLFAGGISYGYRTIEAPGGRQLEINQDQAAIVRGIFEQYVAGASCQRIASELNHRHAPSPRGSSWCVSAIYGSPAKGTGILNNELYAGRYIWNRSQWIKDPDTGVRTRIDRARTDWCIMDRPDLRIVPDELWQAVRRRMDTPQHAGGSRGAGRPARTLFGGLLRCGICGGAVVAINASMYGCAARKDRGESVCQGVYVSRKVAELRILSSLRDDLLSPDALAGVQRELARLVRERGACEAQERQAAQARLSVLNREIDNLVSAVAVAGMSAALRERLADAEAERTRLTIQPRNIDKAPCKVANAIARYRAMMADLSGALKSKPERSREVLREVMGEIRLIPKEAEVWAEFQSPAERMLMISGESLIMVAGVGFEPTTFGL